RAALVGSPRLRAGGPATPADALSPLSPPRSTARRTAARTVSLTAWRAGAPAGEASTARPRDRARRARSLGLAVLASPAGASARHAVSATVLAAVRRAVDAGAGPAPGTAPDDDPTKAALDTLALARELGIDPDLDRAQELLYDAARSGDRPDLAPLAEGLGLSPVLFEARPQDELRTSA
ncbi:MAG TPA: hypothetical protein VJ456_05765, partial [Acidimicrobiia bacterium]|nr:hypothetical protein [Acidimicrobiia bacterium]